ncbi:conjugal transfer protein MobA [Sphingobacterium sp. DR205]|uniref:conjugal transfer protein MobA n=1 Tax=Sphingobacterium sp. DR205 TaxID=2713573 RepID=UPI0013E514A4|nr:conjugal transfer protein MobA [Sphingobacterium sp. DR205]QIH34497.1 hypothetical protein G6053_17080 [Sphingobacterium sp. DR205]
MDNQKKNQIIRSGRKPKHDPAKHRYSISLNATENERFLSLFEKSEMKVMAHFITACIFEKTIKTVRIDMNAVEYHTRLTNLYGQFRAVGVNYNQIVKILYRNFSEKKAAAYLFKLEKETTELAELSRKIIDLTLEFQKKYLEKED